MVNKATASITQSQKDPCQEPNSSSEIPLGASARKDCMLQHTWKVKGSLEQHRPPGRLCIL